MKNFGETLGQMIQVFDEWREVAPAVRSYVFQTMRVPADSRIAPSLGLGGRVEVTLNDELRMRSITRHWSRAEIEQTHMQGRELALFLIAEFGLVRCPECDGRGHITRDGQTYDRCPDCRGFGRLPESASSTRDAAGRTSFQVEHRLCAAGHALPLIDPRERLTCASCRRALALSSGSR